MVVAASDTAQGRVVWETDLAVPPASAPVVEPSGKALAVADANGNMFRLDEASIRSRVQDEPLATRSRPPRVVPLARGVDSGLASKSGCIACTPEVAVGRTSRRRAGMPTGCVFWFSSEVAMPFVQASRSPEHGAPPSSEADKGATRSEILA